MEFNKRLKEIMIYNNLKQKDLAAMLKIDQANISFWLHNRTLPSLDTFYRLCKSLNESADYLLGLID